MQLPLLIWRAQRPASHSDLYTISPAGQVNAIHLLLMCFAATVAEMHDCVKDLIMFAAADRVQTADSKQQQRWSMRFCFLEFPCEQSLSRSRWRYCIVVGCCGYRANIQLALLGLHIKYLMGLWSSLMCAIAYLSYRANKRHIALLCVSKLFSN